MKLPANSEFAYLFSFPVVGLREVDDGWICGWCVPPYEGVASPAGAVGSGEGEASDGAERRERAGWHGRLGFRYRGSKAMRLVVRVNEDALADFVNLPRGDVQGARAFIQRYGIFAIEDLGCVGAMPETVRRFFDGVRGGAGVPFATPVVRFWRVHEEVCDLVDLGQVIRRGNRKAVRDAVVRIVRPVELRETERTGGWLGRARSLYELLANRGLDGMKVRMTEAGGWFVPMACCDDVRTALIWVSVRAGKQLVRRQCRDRKCGRYFFATRPWNWFCSVNCQNRVKVRRWRRAKARREGKRGK
jgi:hypothetical protein